MTGLDVLRYLKALPIGILKHQVVLDQSASRSLSLLEIDDADPGLIHFMSYVEPHSEN